MIQILITYVCGIATGAAATVIFACLIDLTSYYTRKERKIVKKKGIFEP
jgi:hypothetical protein